ncbi:MAG: YicC/YloC family endoribonuclease [Pirellulales bacterium]|nr:YicC/YloC family endoribonuclease [Pirellulales bacterium]
MLLSMTGFGESHVQDQNLAVTLELRTINNRYFKFNLRASEGFTLLEPQIEALAREKIKRGTVQANLRVQRLRPEDCYSLNLAVLTAYQKQLGQFCLEQSLPLVSGVEQLLLLPGVVNEATVSLEQAEAAWPVVARAVEQALSNLQTMRETEGRNMSADLAANCQTLSAQVEQIATRAPLTVSDYRTRLEERVRKALDEFHVSLNPADLLREVTIYAERVDISEELVRLRSHLSQFVKIMQSEESAGRKLEFLIQELFREVNTIGSKSTDVDIAQRVIEMKTAIERLREMIQNVE